jgi:hypothetical protein
MFTVPNSFIIHVIKSRNSLVGIVERHGMDGRGSIRGRAKVFLFFITSRPVLGPSSLLGRFLRGKTAEM